MRPHSGLLLLLCGLACLTGVGIVAFGLGTDSAAAELDPRPPAENGAGPTGSEPVPSAMTAAEGVFRPSDRVTVTEAPLGHSARTAGVIRGDVTLTASTVDKIKAITIRIVEAVRDDSTEHKPFTYQMTMPFDPRDGTPKFAVDDIPFSRYGYLVQAFASGLNGTEQMVVLDEEHPIADVLLGVHPGTPFTVLLRDQELAPLANVEVTLTPDEHPPGRPAYSMVTDSFGAAVFENVLRGPYLAHVGPMAQPIHPPEKVEVMANSGLQAQSKTIVVPKGEALVVNVYNAVGHGVTDIEVRLSSGSDVRYRELKQQTDWAGRCVFEHLVPGTYWLNVTDTRYQPRTVPATVRAGEKPKDVEIRLRMR
ncbi:MAG: carboxypeptidase-like regulatory domain-containing protein [Planctomycetota bacterium]